MFLYLLLLLHIYPLYAQAQIITIPDPVFKTKLLVHEPVIDTNGDGEIQASEASVFNETINVSGESGATTGIEDLTGIEAFTSIEGFNGSYNFFTTANFSANTQLRNITINSTPLEQVNLNNNTVLTTISFSDTNLTAINVANCPDLILLQANFSNLTTLDVSSNPDLQFLYVQVNQLSSVNVSNNTNLVGLLLGDNPLESLDISNNPLLVFLDLRNASLQSLDTSSNPDLRQLDIKNNPSLTYLNLKNGNNDDFDISGGSSSSNFEDLPLLEEVCIDDTNNALANFIQSQTTQTVSFSEKCILSTSNYNNPIALKIYPVPAKNFLYVKSTEPLVGIAIYDMLGRLIFNNENKHGIERIEVSQWASGNYIFKGVTSSGKLTEKLVCKK